MFLSRLRYSSYTSIGKPTASAFSLASASAFSLASASAFSLASASAFSLASASAFSLVSASAFSLASASVLGLASASALSGLLLRRSYHSELQDLALSFHPVTSFDELIGIKK